MKKQYIRPISTKHEIALESIMTISNEELSVHNEVGDNEEYSQKRAWGNDLWQ